MVWDGRHHTILGQPGMIDQGVAAYTFSKSFGMSGWRLGFAVSSPRTITVLDTLTNTALSCVPPFTQVAGVAAMQHDRRYRDERMQEFRRKVETLVSGRRDRWDHLFHAGRKFLRVSLGGDRVQR